MSLNLRQANGWLVPGFDNSLFLLIVNSNFESFILRVMFQKTHKPIPGAPAIHPESTVFETSPK